MVKNVIPKYVLDMFYNDAKKASDSLKNENSIVVSEEITIVDSQIFKTMPDIALIPEQIRTEILLLGHYQKKYVINMPKHIYNISFWSPTATNIREKEKQRVDIFFTQAIQQIFTWLHMVEPYSKANCSKNVDICVWFTDARKVLPAKRGASIGEINVNTAFTSACNSDMSKIYIYRKEEWFKVFIHETFHNLGLDFSTQDTSASERQMSKMFNVEPSSRGIRVYESYCETWGEIIYLFLNAYWDTSNKTECIRATNVYIREQIQFSAIQMSKILHHYDMTYDELIDNSSNKSFKEDSHILSYYIVKFVFLYHSSTFLDWCRQNNYSNSNNMIRFRTSAANINRYISLLSSLYKDKGMTVFINANAVKSKPKGVVSTSLRMVGKLRELRSLRNPP